MTFLAWLASLIFGPRTPAPAATDAPAAQPTVVYIVPGAAQPAPQPAAPASSGTSAGDIAGAVVGDARKAGAVLGALGVSGSGVVSAAAPAIAAAAPIVGAVAIGLGAVAIPIVALVTSKSEAQLLAEAQAAGAQAIQDAGRAGTLTNIGEVPVFKRGQMGPVIA